jgi:hypothetical protein
MTIQTRLCHQDANLLFHLFTPLESPAARSGGDGCSFFSGQGV